VQLSIVLLETPTWLGSVLPPALSLIGKSKIEMIDDVHQTGSHITSERLP
jgi:hypothetical protein